MSDKQQENSNAQLLHSVGIAFSLYSIIPFRQLNFSPANRHKSLYFFPLVGFVKGSSLALVYLGLQLGLTWLKLDQNFPLPGLHLGLALILTFWTHFFSGFIHFDGYLDTHDAKASHLGLADQLRIMSDPHLGAFGLIRGFFYLLAEVLVYFLIVSKQNLKTNSILTSPWRLCILSGLVFALLYTFSGKLIYQLPKAKDQGMAYLISQSRQTKESLIMYLEGGLALLLIALILAQSGLFNPGLFCGLSLALYFFDWQRLTSLIKHYHGVTGDLAGHYLIQLQLISLVLVAYLI